ncbi:MAG: helical backbone metal receptor [Desulfomonilia bacterium]|jgi:ABC-type Fe3+-hydroxamate transport system substrate-binding protein
MRKIIACAGLWAVVLTIAALPARGQAPERIVSLAPSLTRQIADLGEQGRLVGITSFCPELPGASAEVVGTLTLFNFERICALKPDLVLASTDSNRKSDIEKLSALGLEVEVFRGCESFACMCEEFLRLGNVLGKAREADLMVKRISGEIEALRARAGRGSGLRVFWQMGANPLVAAGDETFTGELIRLAGCTNVMKGVHAKYPRVNAEEVVVLDPEVIIVVSGMEGSQDAVAFWSRFERIDAVRTGRVHILSADLVCQPTPRRFLEAFEAVSTLLKAEEP